MRELGARFDGLTERDALERLRVEGANELSREAPRSLLRALVDVLREPMLLLLVAAGAIYWVLGDREEALTLSSFVAVMITIALVQGRKTERAVSALRDLSSPRALVIRDGVERRIAGREVVRGDLLVIAEGDRIAADARVIQSAHLECDESLLTGESVPVRKRVDHRPFGGSQLDSAAQPGGDDEPFVWAGSLAVRGRALAEVVAVGTRTQMGRIGVALAELESGRTRLEVEVARMVRAIAAIGLILCAALVVVYGFTRHDWLGGWLAGIALAMAVLPEEFPVVLTVFMALGAWRLSKIRVLARRLPAVEALGTTTVLCTDKTGTLTENRMRVAELWSPDGAHVVDRGELPECVHRVLEFGWLASQSAPVDPMERAFEALATEKLAGTEHLHFEWRRLREYPLSSALFSVAHVWLSLESARRVVAAKGAPEAIVDLCHLGAVDARAALEAAEELGARGLRVLAVARAWFDAEELPSEQHDFEFEFVGLVGLADPLRAHVADSVAECRAAGIRVVMITGDSPQTARAIARAAGLECDAEAVSGRELDQLSDAELAHLVEHTSVFARAVPEHKLRLVRALQARGEVVAMTGDGVNDAPALKAADIGIALGGRGTDVAREAAALVVTDDDFSSIVAAVRLGRRIYDNLRRAMAYVVAVHVPIAGLSLVPVLFGTPLVLFPVHIVFLELLIDPACSIAFEAEPEESDLMRRAPRAREARVFGAKLLALSVAQGASLLAAAWIAFRVGCGAAANADAGRALAFATLIFGNLALIAVNRSWSESSWSRLKQRNLAAWWVMIGAAATLSLTLEVPWLARLFRFERLELAQIALAVALGFSSLAWFELLKLARPEWLADAAAARFPSAPQSARAVGPRAQSSEEGARLRPPRSETTSVRTQLTDKS